jgi:hypothetical protein
MLEFNPIGFEDPVSWRKIKWSITKIIIINGKIKCREKNRVKGALSTENPPHIQYVIVFPIYGMAESRFVITVAPQNDICPHGST